MSTCVCGVCVVLICITASAFRFCLCCMPSISACHRRKAGHVGTGEGIKSTKARESKRESERVRKRRSSREGWMDLRQVQRRKEYSDKNPEKRVLVRCRWQVSIATVARAYASALASLAALPARIATRTVWSDWAYLT